MWRQKLKNVSKLGLGFSRRWISSEKRQQGGGGRRKRFAALWGNGDYGRLGLGKVDSQWTPTICSALENQNLKVISCGGANTLFLTGSFDSYSLLAT
ncbi:Regulator of chromosome condensation (RCC1) family protein [Thalictrum thalictroides]|uniref:Regulator of chromosome condensation (RCC1) family protein n=1 Tax=Thalictrum thalictroides TaxID=46969 RepID=A0A7J6WQE7_THATH|nr:Regulator of chromosome condensation (RCC1) family protein [Thalictrum thalictroides]